MSKVVNLSFDKLETVRINFNDGKGTDLTSVPMEAVIHATLNDGIALKTYTTGGGAIVGSATGGTWTVPESDMVNLGARSLRYYIRRTDSGSEEVFDKGAFVINPV